MFKYQCKYCKKFQYSASGDKEKEPCIYCRGKIELVKEPETEGEKANDKKGTV